MLPSPIVIGMESTDANQEFFTLSEEQDGIIAEGIKLICRRLLDL